MSEAPTRPVLRWHGGKWRLAPWIISHFPKHRVYVEPFGGAGHRSTGFRANAHRSGTTPAQDWANWPDALPATIARLQGVTIENRDAREVMAQHDGGDTLHYVDPPYLPETRARGNRYDLAWRMYRHELSRDDHGELLVFLAELEGMVVLSGYPDPLYDETLAGWRRIEIKAHADGARERIEVIWINPACAAALDARAGGHGTLLFSHASLVTNLAP